MRNFILTLFVALTTLSLSSCAVSTYAQTTDDYVIESEITYNTIVTCGVPFYINNVLSYYLYKGVYYYPYVYESVEYFRPFATVQPHGFVFVPGRHHVPDYRFGRHPHRRPLFHNPDRMMPQPRPHINHRGFEHRPPMNNFHRSSTRTTVNQRPQNHQPQQMKPQTNFNRGNQGGSRPSGNRGGRR